MAACKKWSLFIHLFYFLHLNYVCVWCFFSFSYHSIVNYIHFGYYFSQGQMSIQSCIRSSIDDVILVPNKQVGHFELKKVILDIKKGLWVRFLTLKAYEIMDSRKVHYGNFNCWKIFNFRSFGTSNMFFWTLKKIMT